MVASVPRGPVQDRLAPIPDVPALRLGPERGGHATVVIADLHLGLEATPDRPLGPPEAAAPDLAARVIAIARTARGSRVVVAGDVKHPIVGVPRYLRPVVFDFFATLLEHGLEVEVVLGNHDVGLVPHLPREVTVHPSSGVVLDEVGIFHGHRWPTAQVLRAPRLVVGHLHPGFRLAPTLDSPGGKQRCWVRVEIPSPEHGARRRRRHEVRARELVVLPAFNPLTGTEALNRERPARGRSFLYKRFLSLGSPRAYLLDGTDLGLVRLPAFPARPRSTRGAPRGR